MIKRIGVLTSGGDAPGMNSAIRSIVKAAHHFDIEVVGIIQGFKGMYTNQYQKLDLKNTSNITSLGGTILKSSRFEEFKRKDIVLECINHVRNQGIEALIVIGGDGTYRGAMSLSKCNMPTIAIPGTIDNDISGTCATIGFDSALMTIVENIEKLKDTARSHNRCLVVEVMGRYCSDLAQYSVMASDSDIVVCSSKDIQIGEISQKVIDTISLKGECIIVVSENVTDVFALASEIECKTKIESRGIKLGYIQRGGTPSSQDRILASRFGIKAVNSIVEGNSNKAICLIDGHITETSIEEALINQVKDRGIYEEFKQLR